MLQHLFNDKATHVISNHNPGHDKFEFCREGDKLQFLVELGYEFGRTGEGDSRDKNDSPVHAAVFADAFPEGATLVVDGEGGNLLNELEEIDGTIEKRRLEFAFKVDIGAPRFCALDVIGDVYQGYDVDSELAKDGADDVRIEDVGLGAFLREAFD